MLSIKEIGQEEFNACFEFDLNSICLWSKKQWKSEFSKIGVKVVALFLSKKIIGICSFQVIIDEAHINYLSINQQYRRKGYGTYFMTYLFRECKLMKLNKLLLEVSEVNLIAEEFYNQFEFLTVGRRKNYYKDGSDAVLKEKNLIN